MSGVGKRLRFEEIPVTSTTPPPAPRKRVMPATAAERYPYKTLIVLKPGALMRKRVGEIITKFEEREFHLVAMKMCSVCLIL